MRAEFFDLRWLVGVGFCGGYLRVGFLHRHTMAHLSLEYVCLSCCSVLLGTEAQFRGSNEQDPDIAHMQENMQIVMFETGLSQGFQNGQLL